MWRKLINLFQLFFLFFWNHWSSLHRSCLCPPAYFIPVFYFMYVSVSVSVRTNHTRLAHTSIKKWKRSRIKYESTERIKRGIHTEAVKNRMISFHSFNICFVFFGIRFMCWINSSFVFHFVGFGPSYSCNYGTCNNELVKLRDKCIKIKINEYRNINLCHTLIMH